MHSVEGICKKEGGHLKYHTILGIEVGGDLITLGIVGVTSHKAIGR